MVPDALDLTKICVCLCVCVCVRGFHESCFGVFFVRAPAKIILFHCFLQVSACVVLLGIVQCTIFVIFLALIALFDGFSGRFRVSVTQSRTCCF